MMSLPAILVIPSVIPSLARIATRWKTFCRSALSCVLLLFAISGSTVMSSVLAHLEAALDDMSTSLFLMWMVDFYSLSALLKSLVSPFILSLEFLYNCLSRTHSICVRIVFAFFYASRRPRSCGGRYPTFPSGIWSLRPCVRGRARRRPW